jgi:hypothetical protein
MQLISLLIGFFLYLVNLAAAAEAQDPCQHALLPTIEESQSDFRSLQSYMRTNAETEYDRLHDMSSEERQTSGSYKFFEAEYGDSKTRSEFREKVNKKLDQLFSSGMESESKALYKRFLSSDQLKAWSQCILVKSGSGGLLLARGRLTQQGFPLTANYVPPQTVYGGELKITVQGGLINGASELVLDTKGTGNQTFAITPKGNSEDVIVIANYRDGISDSISATWGAEPAAIRMGSLQTNVVLCSNSAIATIAPCEHINNSRFIDGNTLVLLCSPGITNLNDGHHGSDRVPTLPNGAEIVSISPAWKVNVPSGSHPKFIVKPERGPEDKTIGEKSVTLTVFCKAAAADVGKQTMPLTIYYKSTEAQ